MDGEIERVGVALRGLGGPPVPPDCQPLAEQVQEFEVQLAALREEMATPGLDEGDLAALRAELNRVMRQRNEQRQLLDECVRRHEPPVNCRAPVYRGGEQTNVDWVNWHGSFGTTIDRYFEPDTLPELVHVVARAGEEARELHALGNGWALEGVAASPQWVVSLRRMNRTISDVLNSALADPGRRATLFHVEAGIEIGVLNERLSTMNLALPTLGGANGQSLAGAVSTSTHGSDLGQPPLCDLVHAIHLVTAQGKELWVERASEPVTTDVRLRPVLPCSSTEIVRDDDIFNAALVSLGRFGVIYSVILEVVPAFRLAEHTVRMAGEAVLDHFAPGVENRTGLEPLLAAVGEPPAELENEPPLHFVNAVFNSSDYRVCWVTRRWRTQGVDTPNLIEPPNPFCSRESARSLLHWASLAFLPLAPAAAERMREALDDPNVTGGQAMALIVNAAWDANLGHLVPLANSYLVGQKVEKPGGRRGPAHLIMTGTRESNQRDCTRGASVEVMFPSDTSAFVDFLRAVLPQGGMFSQAGYVSVRFSRPSRATMSMHNLEAPLAVSIELASLAGLSGNHAWHRLVEREAIDRGGRPHWGQQNTLLEPDVERLYGVDRLLRWRAALRTVSGESMTFSNDYTRRTGLEPRNRDSATFGRQEVPATIPAGGSAEVLVVMRNTGSSTWRAAEGYRLGSQAPQDNTTWGPGRVDLSGDVAPGRDADFRFTITAPVTPAAIPFQWQMLREGVAWFGDPSDEVSVVAAPPSEPPRCDVLRRTINDLDREIEMIENLLVDDPQVDGPRLTALAELRRRREDATSEGTSLGCLL